METYILVLIFFLLLIPAIYVLMKDTPPQTEKLAQQDTTANKSVQPGKAAYGVLAAILAFLFVIALLTQRGRG